MRAHVYTQALKVNGLQADLLGKQPRLAISDSAAQAGHQAAHALRVVPLKAAHLRWQLLILSANLDYVNQALSRLDCDQARYNQLSARLEFSSPSVNRGYHRTIMRVTELARAQT
jgi:hypothetical protein